MRLHTKEMSVLEVMNVSIRAANANIEMGIND